MFFHLDDYGGTSQKSALKLFLKKSDDTGYHVSISNPMQFQLAISYIARGISFRQIRGILEDTKRITGNHDQ